jgi:hypothetical protein
MNFCCSFNPFALKSSTSQRSTSSSTVPLVNFVALNLHSFKNYSKSPLERVRDVTAIRCHPPSLTERMNLRIPSIFETVDLSTLSGMLMVCGGNNGIQFTVEVNLHLLSLFSSLPQEMGTMTTYLTILQDHLQQLDTAHLALLPEISTSRLPYRLTQRLQRTNPPLDPEDILSRPDRYSMNDIHIQVLRCHVLANDVLDIFHELQLLVVHKYTLERERQAQEHQRQHSKQSFSGGDQCSASMIEQKANLEGLQRGPLLSLSPHSSCSVLL